MSTKWAQLHEDPFVLKRITKDEFLNLVRLQLATIPPRLSLTASGKEMASKMRCMTLRQCCT
eukprot:6491399-Amphidinium_carterae.2